KLKIPAGAKPSQKTILAPEALKTLFSSDITTYHGKPIKDFYIHAYRFAVLTGMRPGELLGLRTRDIRGDIVTIRQSVNDNNEITRGKNKNARRTYQLGELALKELEAQRRMLMAAGKISEYVFPREETMDFINQAFFRSRWKRYCAANGITAALTPYELRHTFVSVNVEMPIGLKKMVMGHSENMDTEGVYGHQKKGDMELAAQYIDAAFKKIIG
ncbi:MAG: tyrosine-type recombinase/integrase, partial [Oscillospiraceae bacterium]